MARLSRAQTAPNGQAPGATTFQPDLGYLALAGHRDGTQLRTGLSRISLVGIACHSLVHALHRRIFRLVILESGKRLAGSLRPRRLEWDRCDRTTFYAAAVFHAAWPIARRDHWRPSLYLRFGNNPFKIQRLVSKPHQLIHGEISPARHPRMSQ